VNYYHEILCQNIVNNSLLSGIHKPKIKDRYTYPVTSGLVKKSVSMLVWPCPLTSPSKDSNSTTWPLKSYNCYLNQALVNQWVGGDEFENTKAIWSRYFN